MINHTAIRIALIFILLATIALMVWALSSGANLEEILAISVTGVSAVIIMAFNEKIKTLQ